LCCLKRFKSKLKINLKEKSNVGFKLPLLGLFELDHQMGFQEEKLKRNNRKHSDEHASLEQKDGSVE